MSFGWPAEERLPFQDYPPTGIPAWPEWLLGLAACPPAPPQPRHECRTGTPNSIVGLIRFVVTAPADARNIRTFWGACRMAEAIAAGTVTRSFGEDLLLEAAIQVGLPRLEAIRTIRSGLGGRA
jgi:hypothetical protein